MSGSAGGADPVGAPRVVAVGGGHGLSATLAAVRRYAAEVTAVVSVADDGGSTGRLRAAGERPAPGDLRKCLVALAGAPSPLLGTMDHRFAAGELEGHAFGNLLIAALSETTGDLVAALDDIGALLGCVGRVLPATTVPVVLRARVLGGEVVEGQVSVSERPDVRRVDLEPPDAPACGDAVAAIDRADQVVLGPGSLFTSVLAATAVPGIGAAVAAAGEQGRLVYVCNLRPQQPETAGFGVSDHVDALRRHGIRPSVVLHDPAFLDGAHGVVGRVAAPLARPGAAAHDPELLAAALERLVGGGAAGAAVPGATIGTSRTDLVG